KSINNIDRHGLKEMKVQYTERDILLRSSGKDSRMFLFCQWNQSSESLGKTGFSCSSEEFGKADCGQRDIRAGTSQEKYFPA
ncbi:MAG: hypothetical protein D3904_15555, partial [Candidatus Electrothrix sp. EH2]|nr:hypothetical protein [Candidatus Electrothrix sp. EH2]